MAGKEKTLFDRFIQLDKSISLSLSLSASKTSPLGKYRPHFKALEYSCHGVFWICGTMILLWFSEDQRREAYFFNLLLALLLDILFVAVMKAVFHRKRPSNNEGDDMFFSYSIDKMSCPSGHTSRAILLTNIFIASTPDLHFLHLLLVFWCVCTCASRVLLGRHYVGDVLVGMLLGYLEYYIMDCIWASPESAKWYLDFFKDSNSIVEDL